MTAALWRSLPLLIPCLLVLGHMWFLVIPWPGMGQKTYIDENALQPGQVNTYWNWGDVHRADQYLAELERLRDRNATSDEVASFITIEFQKMGISASSQRYSYKTPDETINGTNAYAVMSSPRASGTEAMVISASWLSRTGEGDGALNLRGVSTVLALANFLRGYSLWAKDLIFVVSDGYLDGMHAWMSTYHGSNQSNMDAEPLELMSGVIWTALNIDYPGHSFSHLGVFFEGLNGRLPNQDLINSFHVISRHTGGVPMVIYDHLEPQESPGRMAELSGTPAWMPRFIKEDALANEYAYRARNLLRHVGYQSQGKANGVHGLLHQFRIDAITLFAVPAPGPHGFHAIGRIVESTLRTMNNLLERLHASFFFYLFLSSTTFLKIGTYLPSVILISTAMMLAGLKEWVNAGWVWIEDSSQTDKKPSNSMNEEHVNGKWVTRRRPVLRVLVIMAITHVLGLVVFVALNTSWYTEKKWGKALTLFMVASNVAMLLMQWHFIRPSSPSTMAPLPIMLKSLNLCLTSAVISIISVLNFSLAALLAVLLGLPSIYSHSSPTFLTRLPRFAVYLLLSFGWLFFDPERIGGAISDWQVLGAWFAPFVCIVYSPLMLQAGLVCFLSP